VICIDASVVAKLLFREDDSAKAFDLVEACSQANQPIVAPNLLPFEITNAVRQRMRREGLVLDQARRLLAQFHAVAISFEVTTSIHDLALQFAERLGLAAAYDAHYLAVAQQNSCNLWTADDKLLRSLRGRLPFVRSLAEYSPSEPV
jgi:predicted nucleic acid-binding protein